MIARAGLILALSLLALGARAQGGAPAAAAPYATRYVLELEGGLELGYARRGDFDVLFAPAVRYFITDGLAVGGSLRVGGATAGYAIFQMVPGLEYSFTLGTKVFPYAGGGIGFNYMSFSATTVFGTVSASMTDFLLDLSGGVKFVLTPHLLVAAGLDLPLVFGDGTAFFFNVTGRLAYFF
ncbi:MAG TPA: hypothetical protein VGQ83_16850 [Polyangia bacterium]|jgi:hypothetical protein